ncbi:MAG: hypothetical protein WBA74_11715, partial [Cyclobacteriaceae bacterium]
MKYSKKSACKYLLSLLGILFLTLFTEAHAQRFSSDFWHPGFIVTAKQDTVRGELKYDMETNSIQLKGDGKIYSFSSHTILICEFYDKTIDNTRRFYSMPYEINKGFKSRVLFELLFEGPTSLLSREEIVQEATNAVGNFGGPGSTIMRDRLKYIFFFLNNKGEIQYYSGKRSELLELMGKKASMVKSFIRQNKLKTDEV